MVPLKLSLKNFLSYGDSTPPLDFRVFDIACLSGKNGHGKSAIIDAITWALWGKCRVKSNEEVIKRGEREAYVELEFEVEKNHYRVIRSLNRKGTVSLPLSSFRYSMQTQTALNHWLKAKKRHRARSKSS
jgi:exonuclease SbcC